MQTARLEKFIFLVVRVSAYLLPFCVLLVTHSLIFPFVTGKNFIFRIIIEVMAAGWIGLLIFDFKKYWPRWNIVSIAYTVFVGSILASAVFGVNFSHSFWSNYERMDGVILHLHLLALLFVLAGTFRTRREWFTLFGVSIVASVLVAIYGLLEFAGVVQALGDGKRIISTLGNPLYVAAYLSFHIFLSAFLWQQAKSQAIRWLLAGVFLFELAVFFLTGARGAFIGVLVGAGIIMVSFIFSMENVKKKILLGALVVLLLTVPFLLNFAKDTPIVKKYDALSRFSNITLSAGEARITLWGIAFEAFKERPIFGWGIENFNSAFAKHYNPKMFGQEPWFDRTHNTPIDWLVSGGLLGLLLYMSVLLSILVALFSAVKHTIVSRQSAFIFIGMFAAYVIQLLFVFDTMATYLMLIMMLGFFFAVSSIGEDQWAKKSTLLYNARDKADTAPSSHAISSPFRILGIVGVFTVAGLLIVMVNVRPMLGNAAFSDTLEVFPDEKTQSLAEKALSLARGTIGTQEIRENLAVSAYEFIQQPDLLKKPEMDAVFSFVVAEMEKQIAENPEKNINIRDNILLAQLYSIRTLVTENPEALASALEQYNKVIAFAPNYVNIYPVLANTLAQNGRVNEAIPIIEKAEELLVNADRYDDRIFYSKPLFYTAVGRYIDAYEALQKISVKNEGRLDPDLMDTVVFATRTHGAGAIPFLEELYLLDTTVVAPLLMLAQIYSEIGDRDAARFYSNKIISQDPAMKERMEAFLRGLDAADLKDNPAEG